MPWLWVNPLFIGRELTTYIWFWSWDGAILGDWGMGAISLQCILDRACVRNALSVCICMTWSNIWIIQLPKQ